MGNSGLKFYVIGDPIKHSLSPLMQNFFLEKFKINGKYVAKQVKIDQLDAVITSFINKGITGINVTTPHKNEVVKYIDDFTAEAENIGSINTIKFENGKLIGHNTDAIGFETSLYRKNYTIDNKNAIIFGAGGAARAVLAALIRGHCRKIVVSNRNAEKAEKLVNDFSNRSADTTLEIVPINSNEVGKTIRSSQLLVNATTVGMNDSAKYSILPGTDYLHRNLLVYDLIYCSCKTKLISQAEACDVPWINGIDMLIFQGIESLKFWIETDLILEESVYFEVKNLLRSKVCQE